MVSVPGESKEPQYPEGFKKSLYECCKAEKLHQ